MNSDKVILHKFAAKVKALRQGKKLSQADAYNDTGIHFGRIEQGKRDVSLTTIIKIAKYFNISPKDLFD